MWGIQNTPRYPDAIDPIEDASRLNTAINNSDKKEIIALVGHRSQKQRHAIRKIFQQIYGKDLIQSIAFPSDVSFETMVKHSFRSPMDLLAIDIYDALRRSRVAHQVLTNILCCLDNSETHRLKKAYADHLEHMNGLKDVNHRSLESDVRKYTRGFYAMLLEEILKCRRHEDSWVDLNSVHFDGQVENHVDPELVLQDAHALHAAAFEVERSETPSAKQRTKTDARVFISILTTRSKLHVRAIWNKYKEWYEMDLVSTVSSAFPEPLRNGLNTMIMSLVNLRLLLVCQLYVAMKKAVVHDSDLIRIFSLHAETDLQELAKDYELYFGESLETASKSNKMGEFRDLLLVILNG